MGGNFTQISTTTGATRVKPSMQTPTNRSPLTSVCVRTPYHNSLPLDTIPRLRSPPNLQVGGNFTPDLHHHQVYRPQTKRANADGWVHSNFSLHRNTIAQFLGTKNRAFLKRVNQ